MYNADLMQIVNAMLAGKRSTDPNAIPGSYMGSVPTGGSYMGSAPAGGSWDGWDRLSAAFTGRGPGGQVSDESIGRASMVHGGIGQIGQGLSQAFNSGGPIVPMPRGYVGPGTTLGANPGAGLESLIAMMLARG